VSQWANWGKQRGRNGAFHLLNWERSDGKAAGLSGPL